MFSENGKLRVGSIVGAVAALIVVILLAAIWPWQSVPTGYRGVITQFGKIEGIKEEGLHFIPPYQSLNNFNIRLETTDVPKAQGSTSDTQPVDVALTVRYSIQPDKVAEVFEKYSRSGDLSSYVDTATQEAFKAVTARYTATDLIAKRQQVSSDVVTTLNAKLAVYGAKVIAVDMRNFEFSKDYMAAVNEKVTQEQKRQAAENKLKTVESEQKQKIAVAEAEAAATRATADGAAYATTKTAEAAANALRLKNAAIRESKDVLVLEQIGVERVKAERWDGHLPSGNVYGTDKASLFMNLPTAATAAAVSK